MMINNGSAVLCNEHIIFCIVNVNSYCTDLFVIVVILYHLAAGFQYVKI